MIGPGTRVDGGGRWRRDISVCDHVVFGKNVAAEIVIDDVDHVIISEADMFGILGMPEENGG